jgi:hypothetical protein
VEDVPHVRLDRFDAQKELGRDLGVRPPVDDRLRDFQLAAGERSDPGCVRRAGAGRAGTRRPRVPSSRSAWSRYGTAHVKWLAAITEPFAGYQQAVGLPHCATPTGRPARA